MQKIQLRNKTFDQITYYKTGNGPSLLLVHGFPANRYLWREIISELSQKYTLLLPDFFEEKGDWLKNGATSMASLSDAFVDILENEKLEKVLYAGHSMGGYMGLAFAKKYPEKLYCLSLIHSSPVGDDESRAEGRKKTIAILEKGGKSPFLKKMVRALFTEQFNTENPMVLARQTEEALLVNEESLIAFYKAIMEREDTSKIVRYAPFPVQYIIGKLDSLATISKELTAENLSNRNFVSVYEAVGHMSMLEKPNLLCKDLQQFFSYALQNQI